VELVNLQQIRRSYGDAMAEQCLLWSVIKIYRVVRESEPAGRVDTAKFGIIFEGVRSRAVLQERMVRLVTAGLMTSRGVKLDIPLQFHVACVLLSERVMPPSVILRDLERLLAKMSPRTRRPIRFVESDEAAAVSMPDDTGAGSLEPASAHSTGQGALARTPSNPSGSSPLSDDR